MNKKVCMLLHEVYPDDIRVSKETKSLIKSGFEIHILCLNRKNESTEEIVNGIHVHRIPIAQTFFWRGIWDILLAISFVQPVFLRRLKALHKKENFALFHVHDLPLAKTAVLAAKKSSNVKVVLDLHENYPEAVKVWFQWKRNPLIRLKNSVFFGFERWLNYEKTACHEADHLIVVVEEMSDRLVALHKLPQSKITVVTNSEGQSFLDQERITNIYDRASEDFILAYTGGVGPHRGVDVAIEGLGLTKSKNIRLEITGSLSADSKEWLTNLATKHKVLDRVRINGYQPFHKFFSYMALADVNLIPHNRNGHTDHTIPHKLFQGMMVGKPVIVSDAPPLKRVVKATNSGLIFEAGNAQDFAKQVDLLYDNPEKAKAFGDNGNQATTKGIWNWEHTGKNLVALYTNLIAN